MTEYKIIADSAVDLPKEYVEQLEIDIVPFSITFDGVSYKQDYYEIDRDEFYANLKKGLFPQTSPPNSSEYMEVFERHLKNGFDILCFTLSDNLSESYQSAQAAKTLLAAEYPGQTIEIVNSMTCALPYSGLVLESVEMKKKGFELERNVEISNQIKDDTIFYVTVDNLEYLKKGGHIGKVVAIAGSIANIKPIIRYYKGEMLPVDKVKGREEAIKTVASLVHQNIDNSSKINYVYAGHTDCEEDLVILKKLLREEYGYEFSEVIAKVGPVIATHLGPSVVASGTVPAFENYI